MAPPSTASFSWMAAPTHDACPPPALYKNPPKLASFEVKFPPVNWSTKDECYKSIESLGTTAESCSRVERQHKRTTCRGYFERRPPSGIRSRNNEYRRKVVQPTGIVLVTTGRRGLDEQTIGTTYRASYPTLNHCSATTTSPAFWV